MLVNKIGNTEKKQSKSYKLPAELVKAMQALDEWLESNREFEGSLEWDSEISHEIKKEIKKRNSKPEKDVVELKLKLSQSTIEQMRSCDKNFNDKGYVVDWDSTLTKILAKLIVSNTKQLATLFNEVPPKGLDSFYNSKNKRKVPRNSDSSEETTPQDATHTVAFEQGEAKDENLQN